LHLNKAINVYFRVKETCHKEPFIVFVASCQEYFLGNKIEESFILEGFSILIWDVSGIILGAYFGDKRLNTFPLNNPNVACSHRDLKLSESN